MRIINAFTLQRVGMDAASGILDWLLTPYYMKRARPNDTIVLYTDENSVKSLETLWPYIAAGYDEVYTDLVKPTNGIFSAPKFEAMECELKNFGTDFIMVDNDIYAFDGFLKHLEDYCVYHDDGFLVDWYHTIMNKEQSVLEAPEWITWKTIPYNCAVIRINDKKLLSEYINLFYTIKAENLSHQRPEKAIIKEQWSLSELLYKYNIFPFSVRNEVTSLHKGALKQRAKPSQVLAIQEYLAKILLPDAFAVYYNLIGCKLNKQAYNVAELATTILLPYEQEGLIQPVIEKIKE